MVRNSSFHIQSMGDTIMYELAASLMCGNLANLARDITELERAGIDGYHIDIMDGKFVTNLFLLR
ncbi:hypothetical protein KAR50_09240 [Periweissella fabaria]|uniref:Ribulose-phosphate 3-epimerase n=1 Tax=Periweissella fabaria TaxID=546157 RepID=A0ABN8BDK8_9LACO|nr:hypothetical protein [Periweissella fabaria]MCM0598014.1 hypothetical protein [Periweissella fabaria]CAH0415926.1 hypothetical protein WFA24289_00224 [Periweissella fabaria]